MYKEFGRLRGQTRRFPRGCRGEGGRVPLLRGGDRLHGRACRFLKIKTGPETACLCGGWCPPAPTATPKSVLRSVPSLGRAVLVSIPFLKKGGRINRKKKKQNQEKPPKLRRYTAGTGRGREGRGQVGGHSFHVPVMAIPSGLGSGLFRPPQRQASRGEDGVGRRGAEGGPGGGGGPGAQSTLWAAASALRRVES